MIEEFCCVDFSVALFCDNLDSTASFTICTVSCTKGKLNESADEMLVLLHAWIQKFSSRGVQDLRLLILYFMLNWT